MRTKVTLVLVLLNVALCFYIIQARHRWSLEEAALAVSHRVLPAEAANIQSLAIAVPGGTPIRLVRTGKDWSLTAPVDWPANPNAVDHILTELQFLEYKHHPFRVADLQKNGQTLADYGLDKPALTLTFTAGIATPPATFALQLGTATAVDNQLYVLSPDGTQVEVVEQRLVETLRLGLDQLCSGAIFTIPVYEARELSLQGGATATRTRLHRDGDRWRFESPIVTRADKAATEIAISDLTSLNVTRFLDPLDAPPDRTGIGTPELRVNLLGNNRQETLLVGRAVAKVPAGSAPTGAPTGGGSTLRYAKLDERKPTFLVEFPNQLFTTLDRVQETLRDHRVVDFDPAAVSALTLAAPGQPTLVLQRLETPAGSAASWQIARTGGAPPLPADREMVQNLLERIAVLTATRFISDAPTPAELESEGFNSPARKVTLMLAPAASPPAPANPPVPAAAPGTTTLSLEVALGAGAAAAARVTSEPFIYAVAPDTLNDLPVAGRVYRDRTVRELPTGAQITGLTLTGTDASTPVYSHQLAAGETWAQALKDEPTERQKALTAMLEGDKAKDAPKPGLLRKLRARRFVSDAYSDTVTLNGQPRKWKYRLDLSIALTGGTAGAQTTTSTLYLAERSGGGTQLAASPKNESDVVFELDPPLVEALFTLTNGARDPGPPAAPAAPTAPTAEVGKPGK